MKPVRTGTRTGWCQWTGGLNVCDDTLVRQTWCEGELSPHNTLNLEENRMQVKQIAPTSVVAFFLCKQRELLSGSLNNQTFGIFSVTGSIIKSFTGLCCKLFSDGPFAAYFYLHYLVCLSAQTWWHNHFRPGDGGEIRQHYFGSGRPACGVKERLLFNRRKNTSKREKPG